MIGVLLTFSLSLFAGPDEQKAARLLRFIESGVSSDGSGLLAEVNQTGWKDTELLRQSLHALRTHGLGNPDFAVMRPIFKKIEKRAPTTNEELFRFWDHIRSMNLFMLLSAWDQFMTAPSTPEVRTALFRSVTEVLIGVDPRAFLLPSGGEALGVHGWAQALLNQVGFMIASPQAKIIATAKLSADWDISQDVRKEAALLLQAFAQAKQTVEKIEDEYLREIGLKMWEDIEKRSQRIAHQTIKNARMLLRPIKPHLLAPLLRECQALVLTLSGSIGAPDQLPPFIEENELLGRMGAFN